MLSIALLAVVAPAAAQVQAPGVPLIGKPIEVATLPDLSVQVQLQVEADKRAPKHQPGGHKFGLDQHLNVSALAAGRWEAAGAEWVWRYTVSSPAAHALLPVFNDWVMPRGARFFVFSDKDTAGAFSAFNNKPNREFAVRPVQGDTVTFEYNGPKDAALRLSIDKVIHVYRGFGTCFGCSQSCNVNANCEEGTEWSRQSAGVTILMNTGSRGYCSGSMINSVSGKQLYLTAEHCQPGSNDIIGFKFEAPGCQDPASAPSYNSAQGLRTLAKGSTSSGTRSDFQIMEVVETIPASWGVYLNGWDATPVPSSGTQLYDDVHAIHHPAADIKKISRSGDGATTAGWGSSTGNTHWWVKTWEKGQSPTLFDYGTTEGGSSGSPLFNEDKQIIGQLTGGAASCSYNYDDYFGAVFQSFTGTSETTDLGVHLRGSDTSITKMDGAELAARQAEHAQRK